MKVLHSFLTGGKLPLGFFSLNTEMYFSRFGSYFESILFLIRLIIDFLLHCVKEGKTWLGVRSEA